MKSRSAIVLFWAAAIAVPALASVVAIAQFPPGVDVPLHWNFSGEVDNWGSPWVMLPASLLMSGTNAVLAALYRYSSEAADLGLVHGVSRKNTRPALCGTAAFIALLMIAILLYWVIAAKAIMS